MYLHFSLNSDQQLYIFKYRGIYNIFFFGDGKIMPKSDKLVGSAKGNWVRSVACIIQKFRPDDLIGSSGFKTDEILERERCLESQGPVPCLCKVITTYSQTDQLVL